MSPGFYVFIDAGITGAQSGSWGKGDFLKILEKKLQGQLMVICES